LLNSTSTQKGQFVPTASAGKGNWLKQIRIANEIQCTIPYVTRYKCNTVHDKTLQLHKHNNRLSNRITYLLIITLLLIKISVSCTSYWFRVALALTCKFLLSNKLLGVEREEDREVRGVEGRRMARCNDLIFCFERLCHVRQLCRGQKHFSTCSGLLSGKINSGQKFWFHHHATLSRKIKLMSSVHKQGMLRC